MQCRLAPHMSLGLSFCFCLLILLSVVEQQLTGPCDDARVIEDDWRYPSEENKRKCDNRLRSGAWYKFKYQGHSAVVAQGPIKENHCGTSGPISVSLQSDTHLYPPPMGQSALYKACVHVTVMGVVTCADHLTIPLLVMTCPDNDVIYFVNETIKECPSAFCITGRDETVDRYYLIDVGEDVKYYSEQPLEHNFLEISQLTSSQMADVVTYETNIQESVVRVEDLKRHIAKVLNLKSWTNCVAIGSNKSSSCLDYEKSVVRSSIAVLGRIITSEDSNETTEGTSISSDVQEEVRNASRLSYESSMLKFAGSLCQVQPDDVKVINLRPRTFDHETRTTLYVESFCGITPGSDLMRSLIWLNSTETLNSIIEAEVRAIFRGFPKDQLPAARISEFYLKSNVWVVIFWCTFVVLTSLLLMYSYFSIKCAADNHMIQKEQIYFINCDGKIDRVNGPSKKRLHKARSRRNTLTSTSKDTFQRQISSISSRRLSSSSKSSVFTSFLKTRRFLKLLRINQKSSIHEGATKATKSDPIETKRKQIQQIQNPIMLNRRPEVIKDNMGWMVPMREFKNSIPIPRLVVDTKRRNCGIRNFNFQLESV